MSHSSGRCARGSHWPKSSRNEKIRSFARARSSSRRAPPNAASKRPCSIASSSVTVWSRLREEPGLDGSHSSLARPAAIESSTFATISVSPSSATRRSRNSSTSGKLWPVSTCMTGNGNEPGRKAFSASRSRTIESLPPENSKTGRSSSAATSRKMWTASDSSACRWSGALTRQQDSRRPGVLYGNLTRFEEFLVQGARQLAARLARERVLDSELVEHADDRAAEVLAAAVLGLRDRGYQRVEPALDVAGVERRERLAQVLIVLEPQPRGEALGRERPGEVAEDRERVVAVAAPGEDPRERDAGVGARGLELERAAQVLLGAGLDERVGLRRQQRVEEARDRRGRLRARELGLEAAVLEGLDGRDALDPERRGEPRVRVGVDLRQRDPVAALLDRLLEHRRELPARRAPRGPEVDDHGKLVGTLDDVALEGLLGAVEDHASRLPGRVRVHPRARRGRARRRGGGGGDPRPAPPRAHRDAALRRHGIARARARRTPRDRLRRARARAFRPRRHRGRLRLREAC